MHSAWDIFSCLWITGAGVIIHLRNETQWLCIRELNFQTESTLLYQENLIDFKVACRTFLLVYQCEFQCAVLSCSVSLCGRLLCRLKYDTGLYWSLYNVSLELVKILFQIKARTMGKNYLQQLERGRLEKMLTILCQNSQAIIRGDISDVPILSVSSKRCRK